jgi:cytochrome c
VRRTRLLTLAVALGCTPAAPTAGTQNGDAPRQPGDGATSTAGDDGGGDTHVHGGDQDVPPLPIRVLVFTRTAGFRHDSIPAAITALQELAAEHHWSLDAREDAGVFNDAALASYDVLVFANTTGDILDATQEAALQRYIRAGGGWVGIHSATDTEHDWPWYGDLAGTYFQDHPAPQSARLRVRDGAHESTRMLPDPWTRTDEWYNFTRAPAGVSVLLALDETSYTGGTMGEHPIAWFHHFDGGRAWYTGGGHTSESYSEPLFRQHLAGGITWAAGTPGGIDPTQPIGELEKIVLEQGLDQPMELDVAPDGRVFFIERRGYVKMHQGGGTRVIGRIDVATDHEDGLLGLALSPDFASTGYIYLFYSSTAATEQHLSRFTINGDTLEPTSERVLLAVPTQRAECCHSGGSLAFGSDGNLFIATGDNTNPFASDGFAPIDERDARSAWDAQRSSANTNDLRGKILRIRPHPDGNYTIPSGNLFDSGGGRPEIYAMGFRNPFRISVDRERGWVYAGDVGPDSGADSGSRGPRGHDEINQVRSPGNFGWPYCVGANYAYRDYDFASGASGTAFNCGAPVNDSPNSTGARNLPAARGAWIWYPHGVSPDFPELEANGGSTALAGPVYHYDASLASHIKLPPDYDDTVFVYDWSRNWVKAVRLDADGNVASIRPFAESFGFQKPIDMAFGPEGALYVLEFGATWDGNQGAQLSRLALTGRGARSPLARLTATPTSGQPPLNVSFSSAGSSDPSGLPLSYAWDFDGNGTTDSTSPSATHRYYARGTFNARLTVSNGASETPGIANVTIVVGNTAPVVTFEEPPSGGIFDWNGTVDFRVRVTDAEDGSTAAGQISCTSVSVQPALGHDTHAHPTIAQPGCSGSFVAALEDDPEWENLFYVIEARYADRGTPQLTGVSAMSLWPRRRQAEHASVISGAIAEFAADTQGGGMDLGFIDHGDYVVLAGVDLRSITGVSYRVASAGSGGRIEARLDSTGGALLGSATVPVTGGWQTYTDVTSTLAGASGRHDLYLVFANAPGASGLFNVNWIEFLGAGVSTGGGSGAMHDAQIRASNGQWVAAEGGGGGDVNANRSAAAQWETFTLIDWNGGTLDTNDAVSFRTYDGVHYLVAVGGGGGAVRATSVQAAAAERFTLIRMSGSGAIGSGTSVAFRASNGQYLVAEGGGGGGLNADRDSVGVWETFTLVLP